MGRAVRSIFDAIAVPHVTVESADAVAGVIQTTGVKAFETRLPAACLLPRRLTSPTLV